MNKFQRVAAKLAKDDINNNSSSHFRILKNNYYNMLKVKAEWPMQKALDFKNWNKRLNELGGSYD